MARRFEIVAINPEDKKLAKINASIHGLQLSDYIGKRIREDTEIQSQLDRVKSEMNEKIQKKRHEFGFFR